MCLFCRILSLSQGSFAKETYNLIDPTNQSHPIPALGRFIHIAAAKIFTCVTWLTRTRHDSFLCVISLIRNHSFVMCLSLAFLQSLSASGNVIPIAAAKIFTCVTWLTRTRHDSFLCVISLICRMALSCFSTVAVGIGQRHSSTHRRKGPAAYSVQRLQVDANPRR